MLYENGADTPARDARQDLINIFDDNRLFTNIVDLQAFLKLPKTPRRIECYDISHLGGTFVYG